MFLRSVDVNMTEYHDVDRVLNLFCGGWFDVQCVSVYIYLLLIVLPPGMNVSQSKTCLVRLEKFIVIHELKLSNSEC